ncbi:hypothetical protein C2E20_0525 [Micractinium conductrix]|uniref:Uncharacterized protein n=1 Tax=Micractinium conductrix TaxID=554055 RepID=A0A2P6VPV4_9CHLO|nr:hypothetical protein C2E20_0525 [Micractinium conductrix]|eukprot:PSC76085.1 hypothetical protein C2E20_0525 [Micractinium conductrix]
MSTLSASARLGVRAFAAARQQSRSPHLAARRLVVSQGERQQQGEAPASPAAAPSPAPAARPSVRVPPQQRRVPPPPPSPYGDNVKVEKVEERGESRFAGVVALDDGDTPNDWSRVALLVGGDAAALLAFAAIGRVSHHEALTLGALVGTAWPFMAGWFGAAALLGGYGKAAQGGDAGAAAGAAAKAWAVGIPVGLLLRSASRGYFPDPSFIGVAMAANGVLLLGWRTALAAATPQATAPQGRGEQLRARKSRKGNPFEMFQMVFSMVKRW